MENYEDSLTSFIVKYLNPGATMHVLLDREPEPGLDLLLHWHPHRILGTDQY